MSTSTSTCTLLDSQSSNTSISDHTLPPSQPSSESTSSPHQSPNPPNPNPKPTIVLRSATEQDIPALVDIQFECFNSLVITSLNDGELPENHNHRLMCEKHVDHLRLDSGLRIIKAVDVSSYDREGGGGGIDGVEETIAGFCMFYFPTFSAGTAEDEDGDEVVLPILLRPKDSKHAPLRPPIPSANTIATATITELKALLEKTSLTQNVSPSISRRSSTSSIVSARSSSTTTSISSSRSASICPNLSHTPPIQISRTNLPSLLTQRQKLINRILALDTCRRGIACVRFMSVHPGYRRCGIGKQMMQWACQRFDELGVDAYLEATAEANRLYRAFGFEEIDEHLLEVDGVVLGRYACMWRRARPVEGVHLTC